MKFHSTKFFTDWLIDWLIGWLTDWLTYLLVPSDKHNSLMAIAAGLFSTLLCPETCLFTNRSSSSACIMVLPKHTFVLLWALFLSSLPRKWQFVVPVLWVRWKTRVSAELAGALLLLGMLPNLFEELDQMERSDTLWSNNALTFKLINGVHALTIKHSVFSAMAALIVGIYFSCLSPFLTLCNGLIMSECQA